jgi:hypothetical protein
VLLLNVLGYEPVLFELNGPWLESGITFVIELNGLWLESGITFVIGGCKTV